MKLITARAWDYVTERRRLNRYIVIGNRLYGDVGVLPVILTDRYSYPNIMGYAPFDYHHCVESFGTVSSGLNDTQSAARAGLSCRMMNADGRWSRIIATIQHTGQEIGFTMAPDLASLANEDFISLYIGILKKVDDRGLYADGSKSQVMRKFPRLRQQDLGFPDGDNRFIPVAFGDFTDTRWGFISGAFLQHPETCQMIMGRLTVSSAIEEDASFTIVWDGSKWVVYDAENEEVATGSSGVSITYTNYFSMEYEQLGTPTEGDVFYVHLYYGGRMPAVRIKKADDRFKSGTFALSQGTVGTVTQLWNRQKAISPSLYTVEQNSAANRGLCIAKIKELFTLSEPAFTAAGAGLNDLSHNNINTGSIKRQYRITIDSAGTPDQFTWARRDYTVGLGWGAWNAESAAANCDTSYVTIELGFQIKWGANTGHSVDTIWYIETGIPGTATATVTALDDFSHTGTSNSEKMRKYEIRIKTAGTIDYVQFREASWNAGGGAWNAYPAGYTDVGYITGGYQSVGWLSVRWENQTGHAVGDKWEVEIRLGTPEYIPGIGGDDLESNGTTYSTTRKRYKIRITNIGASDGFKWQSATYDEETKSWGAYGADSSLLTCSTSYVAIESGLQIKWKSATGHTVDDFWVIEMTPDEEPVITWSGTGLQLDGATAETPADISKALLYLDWSDMSMLGSVLLDESAYLKYRLWCLENQITFVGSLPDTETTLENVLVDLNRHIADVDISDAGWVRLLPFDTTALGTPVVTVTEADRIGAVSYDLESVDAIQNHVEVRCGVTTVIARDERSITNFGRLVGFSRAKTMGITIPYCPDHHVMEFIAANWLAHHKSLHDLFTVTLPCDKWALAQLGDDWIGITDDYLPDRANKTIGLTAKTGRIIRKNIDIDSGNITLTLRS